MEITTLYQSLLGGARVKAHGQLVESGDQEV